MKNDLVITMIDQHNQLKLILGQIIKNLSDKSKFDQKLLSKQLAEFEDELREHLNLENKYFYEKLIKGMISKNVDYKKTQIFIDEMKDIEMRIKDIFKKYKDVEITEKNRIKFITEIDKIKDLLLMRIESEEMGVYMYWKLLS